MARKKVNDVEQTLKKLREAAVDGDCECAHVQADDALCDFLTWLGHDEIVKAYNEVEPKFYV